MCVLKYILYLLLQKFKVTVEMTLFRKADQEYLKVYDGTKIEYRI